MRGAQTISHPKLGQMLLDAGLIQSDQLIEAIKEAAEAKTRLGEFLCSKGIIREDQMVQLLGRQLKVSRYEPERFPINMELASLVSVEVAQRHRLVPLGRQGTVLVIGMSDPTDIDAIDTVEQLTHFEAMPVICTAREINQLTNSLYGSFAGLGNVLDTLNGQAKAPANMAEDVEVGSLLNMAEGAPVVRMVNWIIAQAV